MKKAAATLLAVAVSALAACHTTRNAQSADSFTASMRSDSATISTSTSESRALMLKDDSTFITIVISNTSTPRPTLLHSRQKHG